MIQAVSEPLKINHLSVLNFHAYCATDAKYELEDGTLISKPPEPISNSLVSRRLFMALAKYVPLYSLTYKEVFIEVGGRRVRNPDLLILGEKCFQALERTTQGTITQDMPPPLVAIEIVSPNDENIARDYPYKRSEYLARGISEYWIVDPQEAKITVLALVEEFYKESIYRGEEKINSQAVSKIEIKVSDIL
jgi:Uma2 family endonuclease